MEVAQQDADLSISGFELIRRQGTLDRAQNDSVELRHESEVEIEQLLAIIDKQNPQDRHMNPLADSCDNIRFLPHLPVQGLRVNL